MRLRCLNKEQLSRLIGPIRYHLGMSYIAMGELTKAAEELKKARELAPDNDDLQAKIKAAEKVAM